MGQAGAGGFGAGPLTAAQLGLSSLSLRQQAQDRASALLASNPLPVSGLDPGALASAAINQNQQANQFDLSKVGAQANLTQSQGNIMSSAIGSLGGIAAARFGGFGTSTPGTGSGFGSSGMGLMQNYNPLAGAKPFAMPAGTGGNISFGI
jgi:hypothetical protein